MRKIHVLTRKEDVEPERLARCTAVVIDVLLATSTIALALKHGAKEIIPVRGEAEARTVQAGLQNELCLLCGELDGLTINGFLNPDPASLLMNVLAGKPLILSTTNGTVALENCRSARRLYASSLVNGAAVADCIRHEPDEASVVIVCAGSDGRFALEDFLGAGCLVSHLLEAGGDAWHLSDAATAAVKLYESQAPRHTADLLQQTETAHLLRSLGYTEAVMHAAQVNSVQVVPFWLNGRLTDVNRTEHHTKI
jgi:2-phosphosulfolactate phosphatase